jgi:hypothetical protein
MRSMSSAAKSKGTMRLANSPIDQERSH